MRYAILIVGLASALAWACGGLSTSAQCMANNLDPCVTQFAQTQNDVALGLCLATQAKSCGVVLAITAAAPLK